MFTMHRMTDTPVDTVEKAQGPHVLSAGGRTTRILDHEVLEAFGHIVEQCNSLYACSMGQ